MHRYGLTHTHSPCPLQPLHLYLATVCKTWHALTLPSFLSDTHLKYREISFASCPSSKELRTSYMKATYFHHTTTLWGILVRELVNVSKSPKLLHSCVGIWTWVSHISSSICLVLSRTWLLEFWVERKPHMCAFPNYDGQRVVEAARKAIPLKRHLQALWLARKKKSLLQKVTICFLQSNIWHVSPSFFHICLLQNGDFFHWWKVWGTFCLYQMSSSTNGNICQ